MKSKIQKKEELVNLKDKLAKSKITVFTSFSREGEKGWSVGEFKSGVGEIALRTEVSIVPCYIKGTGELLPKGKGHLLPFVWRALWGSTKRNTVCLTFGKPLYPEDLERAGAYTAKEVTRVVREALQGLQGRE